MSKYMIECAVYVEAEDYESAIETFWTLMGEANIGAVVDGSELPNCFVSEVEEFES